MATLLIFGRRLLLALLIAGYLAFIWWLPPAPTVSVVHAKTEQVSYIVNVPEMARFRLAGYGVRGEAALTIPPVRPPGRATADAAATSRGAGPNPLVCLGGLLEPTAGTKITLRRTNQDPLRIVLERNDDKPVAEFRGTTRAVPQAVQTASWLLVEETESCPGTASRRLPVNGIVELGDELRPQTSLDEASSAPLLEGRIEIFGRTLNVQAMISRWIIDVGEEGRDRRARLYPVMEIALPPGSRVWEAGSPGRADGKAPWAGMALIEPDTTALQVEVTTEANSLAIARPGGGPDPDILRIGMFAQLTNDPNVLSAQLALAVIVGLIQVLGAGLSRKTEK